LRPYLDKLWAILVRKNAPNTKVYRPNGEIFIKLVTLMCFKVAGKMLRIELEMGRDYY
jgi:hypothetical protein